MGTIIKYLSLIGCMLFMQHTFAQPCVKMGQTPPLAIPVCGTTNFIQDSVSICSGTTIPVPPCHDGTVYIDKNPFWYKFHCFVTGTLGFLIVPKQLSDDYDWQLFDVTGHNPMDVYTDASLFVACNWSGVPGTTGTIPNTNSVNSCSSSTDPQTGTPNKTKMPTLIKDHDYLLMVSHYTDNQVGYQITFSGGNAIISDTTIPRVKEARAFCDGTTMYIVMSKRLRCNTLATDGSDFILSPSAANITSAVGNCYGGYDFDSITLSLNKPLAPGNYNLLVQNGTDGNTLLDICYNSVAVGTSIPVTVFPLIETPMDSISPVDSCNPNTVKLVFRRPIKCSSIAPDGSDFTISGPSAVTVTGASGICNGLNETSTITLNFKPAIFTGGTYTVHLKNGTDGNTIIDECNFITTPQIRNFYVKQAVSAKFTSLIKYSCKIADTVFYHHDGNNNTITWNWTFDNGTISNLQNPPAQIYTYNGIRHAHLLVTNKECSDTTTQPLAVNLSNYKAAFDATEYVCPIEVASFVNNSIGNIYSYNWDLGNGNTSNLQTPSSQSYLAVGSTKEYTVQLIIEDTTDGLHCFDTAYRKITAVPGCLIAVPSAFTPNGDGLNDYLYPLNAYKAKNLSFKVYNRYGQLVFETTDWTVKWDGTVNGQKQDPGTYVWMLNYLDEKTNKQVAQKGTVVLIR